MLIIGGIAVLLFGKRLPEVGRSLGQGDCRVQEGNQRDRGRNQFGHDRVEFFHEHVDRFGRDGIGRGAEVRAVNRNP